MSYYNHSKHQKIRFNRSISGTHAAICLDPKYRIIDGRRYSIKLGNLKISGNTIIFNLPPIISCPGAGECKEYCYAMSRLGPIFKNVKIARLENYKHSHEPYFIYDMVRLIKRLCKNYLYIKAVRLHEAGDFYDKLYTNKWIKIAAHFPRLTFYAYTKSIFVQDVKLPKNMRVWYSHGGKYDEQYREEDRQATVIKKDMPEPPGWFVCPTIGNPDMVCGRDCNYCVKGNGRRVAFHMH